MKYYIAYGSNLNLKEMAKRCPKAKIKGKSKINNYELLYKGKKGAAYLTIEEKKNSCVPVGVWEISDEDENALDIYEEYPDLYYKKTLNLDVILNDGRHENLSCFVYIMHEENPIAEPSDEYIESCRKGYEDFGFGYSKELFRVK